MPEPKILPTTFNDALILRALLSVVFPDTFDDELIVYKFVVTLLMLLDLRHLKLKKRSTTI